VDPAAASYRIGLIEGIILLLLVVLAFGSVTTLGRDRWLRLGVTESLLARLAASVVLASIAVGGASAVTLSLLQGAALSDNTLSVAASRNQAILGLSLAMAIAVLSIIRLELYHRRDVNPPSQEEDADWKVEPPEIAGRR
jgi:cell division protein FtsW (lipid II flippase)